VTDGFVIPAGGGERTGNGNILKVGAEHGAFASAFEVSVGPGFDVGAHLHTEAEEFFYILEGELDLLAFEPRVRTESDWVAWTSKDGDPVVRGGPGSFMYVPSGCPHAFANPGPAPARMLFCVAPAGHELYFEDLAATLRSGGFAGLAEVRARHGIEQLTPMGMNHRSR
jgi:oxalate decarboxylase/phosphoglucose isomerase-like protein (cupin superfamily)